MIDTRDTFFQAQPRNERLDAARNKYLRLNETGDIVVFGSGTIAVLCVKYLRECTKARIYVFEQKIGLLDLKNQLSSLKDVFYHPIESGIASTIRQIAPRVIFSVNNTYIFKEPLIALCPIVNYHNALLPNHPGRNAEAWAIFSQDKVSGVTWHVVKSAVDSGEIIAQRKIILPPDITAIRLLSWQAKVAFAIFQDLAGTLLSGRALPLRDQDHTETACFHYSWERPNNGILETTWDLSAMSAFLRAMDYGTLWLLGKPFVQVDGIHYTWKRYSVEPNLSDRKILLDWDHRECTIATEGGIIRLHGLEKV